ncbi:leucyl/phenylalanyl-tRNA--protein transferase [Candidatus Chloroploca sp. Khr17]|uniref:leucyl/phenylalanyl-tRNA--protein transferase n=1 Tax=Candidatus Chloroploca sp. Khr17 TaxID=2496869 RepID=UPI0013EB0FB3|nr:leucyl/phenylalanyl-tRNA--protein transferase [Candidatus Chloroploca sp. Khr17]
MSEIIPDASEAMTSMYYTFALQRIKQCVRPVVCEAAAIILREETKLGEPHVLERYRQGYYPLPGRLDIIRWHNPEVRALLPIGAGFRVEGNAKRLMRKNYFEVTFDQAFERVIHACAEPVPGREKIWITPRIIAAYIRIHKAGYAHSFEVWREGKLVGGGYGVAIGGYFATESQFYRESHASKVGFARLNEHLGTRGFVLHDVQEITNATLQCGAYEVPRAQFEQLLAQAITMKVYF